MTKLIFCILVVMVLLTTGGGTTDDKSNGTVTITDLLGRTVSIAYPVNSVVLTFYFEEYVAIEGGKNPFDRVAGWNRGYWEGRRPKIWETFKSAFPEINDIPDVGYINKGTFNAEKVISLHPDMVIMYPTDYELARDDVAKLDKAGIPVVVVDYHSETLEAYAESTMLLGKILDREERAQKVMDFYREQVEPVTSRLESLHGSKPKVYMEYGNLGPSEYGGTFGRNYMWGGVVDKCRGINIAEEAVETGKSSAISPEYLLKQNPDVIIMTSNVDMGYGAMQNDVNAWLKSFMQRPGWNDLNASKNGRVYAIDHGLCRSLHSFFAVQCVAKCLYPEEFKDLDPAENYREFHRKFLPVEYSGLWIASI